MPEQVPTPYGREHRTDGSEAAERLRSLFGKDEAELLDVTLQYLPSVTDTCRDGLQERIGGMFHLQVDTRLDA